MVSEITKQRDELRDVVRDNWDDDAGLLELEYCCLVV